MSRGIGEEEGDSGVNRDRFSNSYINQNLKIVLEIIPTIFYYLYDFALFSYRLFCYHTVIKVINIFHLEG